MLFYYSGFEGVYMKYLVVAVIIFFSVSSYAQYTDVSDTQAGTWTAANSPYRIVGDVTIVNGTTLTIEPGVEVNFNGAYRILVQGAIYANGTIRDSIIFKHISNGQYHYGIDIDVNSTASQFTYCRIQDGEAMDVGTSYPYNRFGGGIFVYESDTEIINCTFRNNRAWYGAAICCRYAGSPLVQSNRIYDNYASRFGGGICAYGGSGSNVNEAVISNNVIYYNTTDYSFAGDGGGGICLYRQTDVILSNNVVVNNHTEGYGGGLALITSEASTTEETIGTVSNCIFWGNTQTRTPNTGSAQIDTVHNMGYSNLTVDYSDIQGGFIGANNINSDPSFIDISNNDFHLSFGSPCIDTGTSTYAPSIDADSNATNQDGDNSSTNEYDMGAFEFLQEANSFSTILASHDYYLDTFESGSSNQVASISLNGTVSGTGDILVNCYTKSNPVNSPQSATPLTRWYSIIENGSLTYSNANLRLYFSADENLNNLSVSALTLWHSNGSGWQEISGTISRGSNYVQLDGLSSSQLSGYWAFSDPNDHPLPVLLNSFKAKQMENHVLLEWITFSEIQNEGFIIFRKIDSDNNYSMISDYRTNSMLIGAGNSSENKTYHYEDYNVENGKNYSYLLKSMDYNGQIHEYGETNINLQAEQEHPSEFFISSNYPNPFNPTTHFNMNVEEGSTINFHVYNPAGQKIYQENIDKVSGNYKLTWGNDDIPSGIYFYKIYVESKSGFSFSKNGKMVLLK